ARARPLLLSLLALVRIRGSGTLAHRPPRMEFAAARVPLGSRERLRRQGSVTATGLPLALAFWHELGQALSFAFGMFWELLMALILGWQFTLGEFVGGPLMIVLLALVFRLFLKRGLVEEAREQAERGALGRMEGHAEMDMSVRKEGSLWQRLRSPEGYTATAGYFVMDWAAIWIDIVGGLLIA